MTCFDRSMWLEFTQSAISNILTQLIIMLPPFLGIIFIGDEALSGGKGDATALIGGVGLATMVANVICISVGTGFCNVFDTIVAQSYGSGNIEACLSCFWRVRAILLVLYAFMTPALYFAGDLLVMLGQDVSVTEVVREYLRTSMLGMWLYFYASANRKFLRNVGRPASVLRVVLAASLFHVCWLWMFVTFLGWGVRGLALANVATWGLTALGLEIVLWKEAPAIGIDRTWLRPTKDMFHGWSNPLKIGGASMVQLCSEWWFWEIASLMAGYLGPTQLAANVDAMACYMWLSMLYLGSSATGAQLVGREIGAGRSDAARNYALIATIFSSLTWVVPAVFLWFSPIAGVLTADTDVQEVLTVLFRIYSAVGLVDSVQSVLGGIMRGVGRPAFASATYIVVYYVVMLPLAWFLAFPMGWGVAGFWWATCVGICITITVFTVLLRREFAQRCNADDKELAKDLNAA